MRASPRKTVSGATEFWVRTHASTMMRSMAKRLDLSVSHRLSPDEALSRVQALGDYYKNRHGARVSWNGNRGTISTTYLTMKADIDFIVGEGAVRLDGPDPGFLLRGKVTSYLKGKLETYLDPTTPLAELPRN